ncbi:hypothetical protein LXL04_009433 [Taraxacum kok-saghyz]
MGPKAEACAECTQNCLLMHKKERIPSPVATTFFKVMFGDEYSKVLFLPPRFSHGVQEKAGKETWLEDSYGEKWKVKYTEIGDLLAFEEGWNTFCLDHRIKVGDFLVFHYIRESHFVVSMYGESGFPENRHYGFTRHQMKETRKDNKLTNVDHHIQSNAITHCNGHLSEVKDSDGSQQKETRIVKKGSDDHLVASCSRSQPSDSDKETSQRSKLLVNTNPDIDKTVCETPMIVDKNIKEDIGVDSLHDMSIPEIIPEKPSGGRKDDVALAVGGGEDETKVKEPEKVLETSSKKITENPKEITYKPCIKKRLRSTMLPMTPTNIKKRKPVLTSQTDVSGSELSDVGGSSPPPKPIVTPPKIVTKEPISTHKKDATGSKSHNVGPPHKPIVKQTETLKKNRDSLGAKTDAHNDISQKVKPEPVDYDELPSSGPTNSSFSAIMSSYKYLEIPKWVKLKSKVILLRNKSDLWPVLYQSKVGLKALTQSWEAFAVQRGIQLGDKCEFVLESDASSNSTCSVFKGLKAATIKNEGNKVKLSIINKDRLSPSASHCKELEIRETRKRSDSMEGTEGTQQPHLVLANKLFLLTHSDVDDIEKVRLRDEVMSTVVADDMAPLYETLAADLVLQLDQKVLDSMRAKISEELKKLDEKIADAEENLGESEVREAHLAKSLFYIRIGDKEKALEQLKVTEGKTVAVGQRMDLVFYTLQMGFFYMDFDLISRSIDKAKNLFEEGGDWERKNRLKVYEGLYCMSTRNFKKAADLFLDSISTFTTYELFPYDTFIFYTVLASIISLDRVSLKQKVVDAPEILTVIGKIPFLSEFMNSLYECQYKSFFSAFAGITEHIKLDRYLHPHFRFYMREIRTVVYSQFLESYKSVTIEAMAKAFGVTVDFIDLELSRFIAAGKLHCKIDKVAGVLETNRPDAKNALYQATIKQGDFLLNRIQKLSRVIDL